MEAAGLLISSRLTTRRSWLLNALNGMRNLVVDQVEVVAIEEAAGGVLLTLAELTIINAIAGALIPQERKQHQGDELCFK
jgi:hypothetical protein